MLRAILFLILLAPPALAQDLVYEPRATRCAPGASAESAESCIGSSQRYCMENTPGGQTTSVIERCIDAEYREWDARLELLFQALMRKHAAFEAENPAIIMTSFTESFRDMHEAWIVYRDAACLFERATWTNGSGATTGQSFCLLEMTARKAIEYQFDL